MKARIFTYIGLVTLFIALAASFPLAAQDGSNLSSAPRKYTVQVLPGLGGLSGASSINDRGWVTGLSNPPVDLCVASGFAADCFDHAILWRGGELTDLGTLGGYNSTGPSNNRNERGWVVGISETEDNDPYQENFGGFGVGCTSFGPGGCAPVTQISKGYLWQSKTGMIALPPLPGGNNSVGSGANNEEIFGVAENGVVDPYCVKPQVFDFEGVVWSLGSDGTPFVSRRLLPIADDTISAGLGINEVGDIVGASGRCGPLAPGIAKHAVLWKKDGSGGIDLDNLGGTTNNVAAAINNQGQVVGSSDLPGDTVTHAFLWNEGGVMQDLGALPGDDSAAGEGINDRGEVVGISCNSTSGMCRGFHWQGGVMTDMNSVLPPGSSLLITNAADINNRGEIAIQAFDPSFGDFVAAVLIPSGNDDGPLGDSAAANTLQRTVILPENVRKTLQQRGFGHFAGGPVTPQ